MNPLLILLLASNVGLFIAVNKLWIELKAMQKSTHQVTYVNGGADYEKLTEELKDKLTKPDFDNVM